jgi:putative flippase GtrA
MNILMEKLAHWFSDLFDIFHRPFHRLIPLQTFRYLVAGGANTFLGLLVYYLGFYAFKAHSASLFCSFLVTFPVGFFFARYVVFENSLLRGRVQLFRYLLVCLFNLALNYILLKTFVEVLNWQAIFSQLITVILVVAFSYIAQRNFSFRSQKNQTNC